MPKRTNENKSPSSRKAPEPPALRETKKGNLRRKKLLETAARLFLEKGFDETSLNEIVKIAGGSLSTIYKYFGDKEKLFIAVFKFSLEQTQSELEKIPPVAVSGASAQEYLRHAVEVIYRGGFEKKFICFFSYGIRSLTFRKLVLNIIEEKIIAPLRQIFQTIENGGVRFTLGKEETLLTVIRLVRGTSLEFIIDGENLTARKEAAVQQTMTILQKLIEFPKTAGSGKAESPRTSRSKKQSATVERR